jgi:hypothetical protein
MMRLVQQLQGAVITAFVPKVGVDRGMIIQVLPIINRSALDFADGLIDLGDGVIFFPIHAAGPCPLLQMSTGVAQVGEGVEVCRMLIGKAQRGAGSSK